MNAQIDSPCPSRNRSGLGGRQQYQAIDPWNDGTLGDFENTAAIDFTTEIRIPSLAREKPRRAHTKTSFAIHDDNQQNTISASSSVAKHTTLKRKTQDGRSSLLAQPAQRFQRPRVSTAGTLPTENPNTGKKAISGRQPGNFETSQSYQKGGSTSASTQPENDALKKDVRRETVYIPTEDTTMPAVFMKLFSPLKSNQLNANGLNPANDTASINSLEARIAAKRKPRTSAAPKRAPLQEATRVPQQLAVYKNVFGRNGGKENIPPGYVVEDGTKFNPKDEGFPVFEMPPKKPLQTIRKTETRFLKQAEKSRKPIAKATRENPPKVSVKKTDSQKTKKITPKLHEKTSLMGLKDTGTENPKSTGSIIRNKLSVSQIPPVTIDQRYPLLDNDITNPMMYEENWLLHQEIVITQLVNGLFDSANGQLDAGNPDVLRHELLQIYQSDMFLLLYKRLHASILYGALAPPKEALRRGSRLSNDVGMKRTFLSFWTETYDLHALRAAAEVVIGRRISPLAQTNDQLSDSVAKKQKGLKRTLETFLETFLIRNEDKDQPAASQDEVPGSSYRYTILRSILIIILLDRGRLVPRTSLPKRLFATSSAHKSSTTAMQALTNQLLPSTGDITRPLNHLDCQLYYKQHKLQDQEFHINNLAVDLRDGVVLTRLVELFLYPSALQLSSGLEIDATTSMTEAKVENEWPLSQHLKLPCTSRATKLFNTQIALKALREIKEVKHATKDICAEDIVDGHREKTISLLWGLVGIWGLTELIDWDDVRNEITRLQKKASSCPDSAAQDGGKLPNLDSTSHKEMLVKWASILAQLKGLRLDNLSTSFADGRIFESIIDEYEGYLTGEQSAIHTLCPKNLADKKFSLQNRGLEARLQSLGCSSQFASLVALPSTGSRILDSDLVLGALTFLCSRLLTSSKRIRATIVIQTAWRQVLASRAIHRRALAKRTAEQCAAVVNARDRILWAKSVIVAWWRKQNQKKRKTALKRTKFPSHKTKGYKSGRNQRTTKGVADMSAILSNGGSSTCVVELRSTTTFASSTKEDGRRTPGLTLNTERPDSNGDDNDHPAGWDQDTESPGPERAVAHAREKWNLPVVNAPRTFATFWSFVIMGANDAAYGALIPYLETYYNLSYTIVSLVFLSPLVGYAVAALFNHAIHMRLGQRGIAILSSGFHLIAYVINSVHPPFPVLVVSFIFAGLGNGLADSAWNAWAGNLANANEVLGFLHGFYGLGAVLSPLVATSLITKAQWEWYTFYYLMIGGAVIELAFGTFAFWGANQYDFRKRIAQTSEQSSEHKGGNGLKEALLTKPAARVTWLCAAFLLGYVGAEVALGGWIVTFMMRVRHGGAFASGMTATGFWIGITVGRVVLGFVTPRIGEKFAISVYLLLAMAFELIFWLVPQFYVSAVAIAIQGFFLGPLFPAAVVAATKLLPKHLHVSSIGFAAALGGAGAAVFPFAVGAIAQAKGVQVLQPFALALLIAVLGAWVLLPRMPKNDENSLASQTPSSLTSRRYNCLAVFVCKSSFILFSFFAVLCSHYPASLLASPPIANAQTHKTHKSIYIYTKMLEARLEQASLLKKVVDAIKDLVQDCNFDCNDTGIALQAMDNSHVALVSMLMKAEGFSPYRCDRNIALGINLVSLTKVLRAAQNEDILTLKAEDSPDVVNLMFESAETDRLSEYDIKLMDIDQEHLAIPETEYAATVSMPAAEFRRICVDLNALSESVVIEATKEGIKFSCQGDIGNGSVTVRQNTNVDKPEQNVSIQLSEPVALTFSLKYLVNFCKATALSTQVHLCLSQEVPLRVEYSLGSGHLRFFLAPKIGEED